MRRVSHRSDPVVPDFDDTHPVMVFDGVCHLCSGAARLIHSRETRPIYFVPIQSNLGKSLLAHYDLNPADPTSFLYLEDGIVRTDSAAVFALFKKIKGWPRLINVFSLLPRGVTDWAYRIVARNRYALFGKSVTCVIPAPTLRARFLDMPELNFDPQRESTP